MSSSPPPRRPRPLVRVGLCGCAAVAALNQLAFVASLSPLTSAPRAAGRTRLWAEIEPPPPADEWTEPTGNLIAGKQTSHNKLGSVIVRLLEKKGSAAVQATGKESVNVALKSVLEADSFFHFDGAHKGEVLAFVPTFEHGSAAFDHGTGTTMVLTIRPMAAAAPVAEKDCIVTTGDDKKIPGMAGKIKFSVTEKGVARVNAAGADRTYRAMKAIVKANQYYGYEGGTEKMACAPSWEKVVKGEKVVNGSEPTEAIQEYVRMAFDCMVQAA